MGNLVGKQFGNYLLTRFLDDGAFAEVYLGEHKTLGTQVAVKVQKTSLAKSQIHQFQTEATTIAKLTHPHIVRVFDFGVESNTPFMVMDYAANGTLRRRYPTGTPVPLQSVVSYVKQVAEALQYAHNAKLIHRDVKPENMLLGPHDQVWLSDFGIAVIAHSTHSMILQDKIGTLEYMAPEQLQGKPVIASDQYALGIVAYEWLCGETPFQGTMLEILTQHLSVAPPSLSTKVPTISSAVEQVIFKALAKDPHQRFSSVQEFAQALERASPSGSVPALNQPVPASVVAKAAPPTRKLPLSPQQPLPQVRPKTIPVYTYRVHNGAVTDVTWSLNGQFIASYRNDKSGMQVWNTATRSITFTYQGQSPRSTSLFSPRLRITDAQWSPIDQSIAIRDDKVAIWDVNANSMIATYKLPLFEFSGVRNVKLLWSPDAKHIAAFGYSEKTMESPIYYRLRYLNGLAINEVNSKDAILKFGDSILCPSSLWSSDGKQIVTTNGTRIQIWDVDTGGMNFSFDCGAVHDLTWLSNDKYIAYINNDILQVADISTGNTIWKRDLDYFGYGETIPRVISCSKDDKYVATVGCPVVIYNSHYRSNTYQWKSYLNVYDAVTGNTVIHSEFPSSSYNIVWSLDGTYILIISTMMARAQGYNLLSKKAVFTYESIATQNLSFFHVKLSPDGTRIATTSQDKTLQLWDANTGSHIISYPGYAGRLRALAWSPDSTHVATASDDGTIQVWQAT